MSIYEAFTLALGNLRTNKMRSGLTLLGVVIGIASVIAIMTLSEGLRKSTIEDLAVYGGEDMTMVVQEIPEPEVLEQAYDAETYFTTERLDDPSYEFSLDDIEQLRVQYPDAIQYIGLGENNSASGEVYNGSESTAGTVKFQNPDMLTMRNVEIAAGRSLSEEDIQNNNPVAVVSETIVEKLFGGNNSAALGTEISFESEGNINYFTIIGVEKTKQLNPLMGGSMAESSIYVPYTMEGYFTDNAGTWQTISVRGPEDGDKDQLKADLKEFLQEKIGDNEVYEGKVIDGRIYAEQAGGSLDIMKTVLSAIGAISLLVGGIGVMNIMLVTVTERTREIGIRKALGAKRSDIRRQFITEAIVVCFIGGIIGILLGGGLGMLGTKMMVNSLSYPPVSSMVLAFVFCMAIGLFFGWYPAGKASKLDPIEALRYE